MIDLYSKQKECVINALKRCKIKMQDLILPEWEKFIKKIKEETLEAETCCINNDFKLRIENEKPEGLPSELADIVITCMTFAECLGLDLEKEIITKLEYNKKRLD